VHHGSTIEAWLFQVQLGEVMEGFGNIPLMHPKFFDGLNYTSKDENNRRRRSWSMLPGLWHFEGKGVC
jgi:hypothetical protein